MYFMFINKAVSTPASAHSDNIFTMDGIPESLANVSCLQELHLETAVFLLLNINNC